MYIDVAYDRRAVFFLCGLRGVGLLKTPAVCRSACGPYETVPTWLHTSLAEVAAPPTLCCCSMSLSHLPFLLFIFRDRSRAICSSHSLRLLLVPSVCATSVHPPSRLLSIYKRFPATFTAQCQLTGPPNETSQAMHTTCLDSRLRHASTDVQLRRQRSVTKHQTDGHEA
jgi:hypothetical protein